MIRHLRWKVAGITVAFCAAILLCVFLGVYHTTRVSLQENTQAQLRQALQRGEDGGLPCFVVEVYPTGRVHITASSYYQLTDALLSQVVSAAVSADEDAGLLEDYQLRYLRQASPLSLRIAFTDSSLEQATLRALVRTGLIIGVVALAVLLGCAYALAGLVTKPVARAWESQRRFLSDASHELKTPLTVVLSSAELLGEHTTEASAPYVENIRAEGLRMRSLVEDMLTLSRMESQRPGQRHEVLDLSDLTTEVALRFEPVAFEAGRELRYDVEPGILLSGDAPQLTQLLGILLDNAIKYAPAGSAASLTLRRQDKQAILQLINGGDPIPPEHLPHLFERFYRADESRSDHGSFGLGLAIAKAITEEHGGTIRAESDSRGTMFTVSLPMKREHTGGRNHVA